MGAYWSPASNKVNQVIGRFERIQTVDSLKLLGKLQAGAEQKGVKCKILLQVNTGRIRQVRAFVRNKWTQCSSGLWLAPISWWKV